MITNIVTPVLPELDTDLGNEIGDEILLDSASTDKVAKVSGTRSSLQSHSARAWTMGGSVD